MSSEKYPKMKLKSCDHKSNQQDSSLKCSAWQGFTKFLLKKNLGPKKKFQKNVGPEKKICV